MIYFMSVDTAYTSVKRHKNATALLQLDYLLILAVMVFLKICQDEIHFKAFFFRLLVSYIELRCELLRIKYWQLHINDIDINNFASNINFINFSSLFILYFFFF